jgi:hypothetical protein
MVMNRDERLKMQQLLDRILESNTPTQGNIAVFLDEQDTLLYSGMISEWPMIIAVDVEWGEVKEMDATKAPFAGKKVKLYTMLVGN